MKWLVAVIAVVIVAGAVRPESAALALLQESKGKPAGVSGTWMLEVTTEGGSGSPTVTFKQDGEKLTGHYSGRFGESSVTGTLKRNAITFSVEISAQGQSVTVVYRGTVDKDTMKGTVQFGDFGGGTFTGRKK